MKSPSTSLPAAESALYRLIPAIGSLRTYTFATFGKDLFAGLTVAAVAVPQAMAYASIFGVPVQYGLYTAIVMTAVGALFDSSKQLINGPTNAICIALLSALGHIPVDQRVPAAIMMALMIGSLQTGITLLRLGDLSRYISHAVIVGFTAGASILLVLDQLKNVLGLKAVGDVHDSFIKRFWLTMTEGGMINWPTVGVAVGTIAVALVLRGVNNRWRLGLPELLLAIVAAGFAVFTWKLDTYGVKLIDKVPRELPSFHVPMVDTRLARELLPSATAIALLGLLEAIAMAKSLAARTRQKLDINQQCLSEGLANLAGSFFQCFPGSGSLTRSYINHQAGAATQWSGVISAAAVALTLVALAPLAQYIPKAALAGVLLMAATRMIDLRGVLYHCRTTRFDAIIVLATAAAAVLVSIEYCILIGTFLSFVIYVPRAARIEVNELVMTDKGAIRERASGQDACPLIKIYDFEGELFFGASPELQTQLEHIEASIQPETVAVVLRLKHVRNPDAVCMHELKESIQRLQELGVQVALSGVRDAEYPTLEKSGLVDIVGPERVFRETPSVWSSTTTAIHWAYDQLGEERCECCPRAAGGAGMNWHFEI